MNKEERLKAAEAAYPFKCEDKGNCIHDWCAIKNAERKAFIKGAEAEAESKNILTDEEMRQPIEDALYSTKNFLTTQASELADGILLCLKEDGYCIIKTP